MKIIIELNTDNAAFEDDTQIKRILIQAAKSIADGTAQGILSDINGNKVGFFTTENN